MTEGFERTTGALGVRIGSTMTGKVYTERPSERFDVAGAPIERIVRSRSGNSSHFVR